MPSKTGKDCDYKVFWPNNEEIEIFFFNRTMKNSNRRTFLPWMEWTILTKGDAVLLMIPHY